MLYLMLDIMDQERLTIDIGFETVKTTSSNDVTNLTQASGFENVLGSSKDDTIISSGATNKIAGGSGDDVLIGDDQDFADYSLEQSFSHQSQAFHLNEGIVANLQTGQVIDTYGYKDTLQKNNEGLGIKNIIGTSKDDTIIGSDQGSQILSGEGNDLITITAGENIVIAGLGDDQINIEAKNGVIYGDAPGYSEGKDTFLN